MKMTIKAKRISLNLSQDQVAAKAGIPTSTYRYWEANNSSKALQIAEKIAKALDCRPEELFFTS